MRCPTITRTPADEPTVLRHFVVVIITGISKPLTGRLLVVLVSHADRLSATMLYRCCAALMRQLARNRAEVPETYI